jgi:ATP-dependent DNA helicase RecQ
VSDNKNDYEDPVADCCKSIFGIPYPYPWQRLIIAAVLDATLAAGITAEAPEPLRQIAVLPTGAGKSLCWMLPAVMIEGLTVAVFPLLSLMSDQERRLKEAGIDSVTLRGGQDKAERRRIWGLLESRKVNIVLANPEVLQGKEAGRRLAALEPAFMVVDETHTVSQWGESFRPACAGMGSIVKEWKPQAVLALTATAGPQIRDRITELLFNGERPSEALADPDRPSIRYGVIPALSRNHLLERLAREESRPLIVFGPTRSSVEQAARLLRYRLHDDEIRYYHAGLSREEKSRLENWFLTADNGVLCATCAYGMGVDKSNVRTIVHLSPPASTEAYLQESGRASRDGKGANAWLIWSAADSSATDTRRHGMIRYASSTDRCRREMLLDALGIETQDCSGCDVCGGEPWTAAPEEKIILKVIRWNRGRFRKGQMARILIGRRSAEIRRAGLDTVRGFGALAGWELEDAEEAIGVLLQIGKIRFRPWIWTNSKLVPVNSGNMSWRRLYN